MNRRIQNIERLLKDFVASASAGYYFFNFKKGIMWMDSESYPYNYYPDSRITRGVTFGFFDEGRYKSNYKDMSEEYLRRLESFLTNRGGSQFSSTKKKTKQMPSK